MGRAPFDGAGDCAPAGKAIKAAAETESKASDASFVSIWKPLLSRDPDNPARGAEAIIEFSCNKSCSVGK